MNVLALCAGVGGLELGVKLANSTARCVCYVEGEAYAASILVKRMEEEILDQAPVWSDVRTFDGKPWCAKVDCITGGYPCQPFSLAGARKGKDDPRHLWTSIKRIIGEVQPKICFFENVAGHLSLGFEAVADDLQGMGYKVAAGLFSAEEVGASHRRERVFIMANRGGAWGRSSSSCKCDLERVDDSVQNKQHKSPSGIGNCCKEMERSIFPPLPDEQWLKIVDNLKPAICRMAHGLGDRMDRIQACGNGVVPLAAGYAWRVLEDCLQMGGSC